MGTIQDKEIEYQRKACGAVMEKDETYEARYTNAQPAGISSVRRRPLLGFKTVAQKRDVGNVQTGFPMCAAPIVIEVLLKR